MRLMTTAGSYAGHVRDYEYGAAMAALHSGMARRVDDSAMTHGDAHEPRIEAAAGRVDAREYQRRNKHRR